uniref:Uncharacterized protein n=2 Tax=Nothobranchius korthausae TaxID=1143690 RepID=A0A1A8G553_9TELE
MSRAPVLMALVKQRLVAAAEEICGLFEGAIAEYEEEIERQRCLLEVHVEPERPGADVYRFADREEEFPSKQKSRSSRLEEEPLKLPHMKEEQEELQVRKTTEVTEFCPKTVKNEAQSLCSGQMEVEKHHEVLESDPDNSIPDPSEPVNKVKEPHHRKENRGAAGQMKDDAAHSLAIQTDVRVADLGINAERKSFVALTAGKSSF